MRRSVRLYGSRGLGFACLGLILAAGVTLPAQQQIVPGTNVNMVSGTKFPEGDPYLQRQNEPSSAVSTRNPLHILGGANDYRTVDIPHPLDTLRTHLMNSDAWVGLFKSFDAGQNWKSTLIPGYPQDPARTAPLFGYDAATDPFVRAGTNGMFYFAGLAFDRGENAPSAIFVARFMDMNNLEAGDPIVHLDTRIVDSDTGTRFLDKTALATDVPRTAATCSFNVPLGDAANTVVPQTIPAGNVYIAYSAFTGSGDAEQSVILFSRSTNCGTTWSAPKALSTGSRLVQNAQIAVDPATGYVYVSWRRFKYLSQDDAVMVVRSTDGGVTFGKPVRVAGVQPFDQPTKETSFRSNGFQTMTVDAVGRVYLAWTERGHATLRPSTVDGDARIVITTSTNGTTWTVPRAIAPDGLGHQLMPALTFHAGKLRLLYYDLREDVSQVFAPFVDEFNILQANSPVRHTMDVFVAQATPGVAPAFTTARLSDYAFGFVPGGDAPVRLQYNPPNLPLFKQGTTPFMGDYIDLAPAPAFVQNANGTWSHNTAPSTSAASHAFWTDNRDVRPPKDGDWTNYSPPQSPELGTKSRFDPTIDVKACTPGHEGMRNQNIYTARVTEGLFVSAPGNNKPLGTLQRAFVVVAENATGLVRSFRLTIANQPIGGQASFLQFSALPTLDVTVPPFSSVARSVFASSSNERARITVSIVEISAPGGGVVAGGLAGSVVLNADPDPLAPRLENPRLENPRLENPSIQTAEVYNAGITNAVFAVPRLENPRLENPTIENPRLENDALGNPRLENDAIANDAVANVSATAPRLENPRLENPRLENPRLENQALDDAGFSDTSWALTNNGNTTAAYTINLVLNQAIPNGFTSQLLIHKTTTTPASIDCKLAEQLHTVLVANIPDPQFVPFADIENPRLENPRLENPTLALAPGESATITLRIVDPNRFDAVTYDASGAVTPAAVAQSVNTEDVAAGITTPSVAVPLTITTTAMPPAVPGAPYTRSLQTLASVGALTCSVVSGTLPAGMNLSSTGTISGTPTIPGNYRFTVRCVDANGTADDQELFIQVEPPVPAGFDAAWNGADTDWSNPDNWSPRGVPLATARVYIPASISVVPTLTRNVTIRDLVVEPGARVDTNGFTLTITHNADAGRTIVGTGTTVLTGDGAVASGVFSNLEIRGRITLNGPVTATGRLTLADGSRLNLNGQSLIVGGQLTSNTVTGTPPVVSGPASSFIVAGVLVNGLVLENAPLTIDGSGGTAALSQFDNVRFGSFAPEAVQLTINHPGLPNHFAISGASFFTSPTTGRLLQANDTNDGANTLIVDVVRAVPADGTPATSTNGGAVVNWIFDAGDANLAVTQTVSPVPAVAGTPLTYVITVTNGGPAAATGVTLNAGIPIGAASISASTTQGTCTVGVGAMTCSLGAIPAGSQAVTMVSFIPPNAGTIVTTATVSSAGLDSSQANNTHTIAATVVGAGAAVSLTLAKTGPAASVAIGTPFTYALTVTNAGLTTATGVTVTDPIPAGLTVASAVASQGACAIAAGQIVCSLGTMSAGQAVTITLSATATVAGLVTNAASVTADGIELTPADNVAVVQTMVLATAACSVPTFSGPVSYPGSPGPTAVVKLVDMDHDGDLDAVATHEINGGGVDVFLNDGAGHFGAPRFTSTITGPWIHAVADFNGDTHPDVISSSDGTNGNPPTLRLLTNDGTGTLTLVPTFSIPFGGWLEAVDIDRDGDQDVVFVTPQDNVALLRNDGAGNFSAPVTIVSGPAGFFGLGDYNGDNRTDFIVPLGAAGYGVVLADTAGGFLAPVVHAVPGGVNAGSAADLNGDGHLDLLLIAGDNEPTGQASVVLGDGAGGFGSPIEVPAGSSFIYFPTLSDVNGDGKFDLVAISGLNGFEVRLGDGAGGFSAAVQFANATNYGPTVGDVNGDGRADIVTGDRTGQLNVFLNNCGAAPTNLGVAVSDSADPVNEGDEVTYTVTLTNHGDTAATGVRVTSVLTGLTSGEPEEPNAAVVATTSSAEGGTLATSGSTFTWVLPTVAAHGTATFEFRFRTLGGGQLLFTTGATSDGAELDPSDNTASAATTVNATGRTLTVTNTNNSGPGSLRQALIESNGDGDDVDRIVFNIGTGGPQTITVLTPLPDVSQPAIIDGTTQPGFSGTPIVELNGNGLTGANGLSISGGNTTVRGLVINRFGQSGIALFNGGGNVIEGSYIGVDASGAAARPNTQQGVLILSSNNRLGGPTPAARNTVSGNTGNGVSIVGASATGNVVQGNYVGTNASGTAAVPNLGAEGILIINASGNSILANVVSGNASHGVQVFGGTSAANIVQGNFIGTDPTGTSRIANAFVGVQVWSAVNTVIGGPGAARNIVSGNSTGIELRTGATGTRVENNYIGINAAGTAAIANGVGISITDAANGNTIGGTTAGAGNVISGNTNSGVSVTNNAQFNLIQGNRIGTNANGIGAVPNGTGVSVSAPNTTVGGTNPLARNVLSGNTGYGVSLTSSSQDSVVQGNYIGTDIAGTAAVPNGLSGVNVSAFRVTIGGTAAGAGNVISGNLQNGIRVSLAAQIQVQGNFIGTVATGTAALANGSDGVSIISADDNTIGGTAAGARNVISGNVGNGISINSAALDNIIQGNLIGTNAAGTATLGNLRGILNAGANTIIGGTTAAARNVISGNATQGVALAQPSSLNGGADRTTVQGNFIGTDIAGTGAIPNLSHGVSLSTAWITIGGTQVGAGNIIRNNGGAGVAVSGSTAWNNRIQGNSISGNGGIGIDLNADGVTANDSGDADDGPNHLQNFPVITSALEIDGVMTVQGSLNSTPNTTFRIEFFSSATCDALGNGEGRDFLGATDVTTNATGTVSFSATPTLGTLVTATATDPAGNTSEFSNCRVVIEGPADASISIAESADPVVVGTPFTYTLTMQNAGPNVARSVRVVDTLPAGVVATAAQSTRGTCTIGTGQVTCNLGNVPIGQNAVITLTVIASTAGLITNSASVDIAQVDQNATNDTDTEQTLVQATAACTNGGASGPTILQTGGNTFDVLTGDLNGDGKLDLVAPVPSLNSVAVFLGNGAGGFGAATLFPAGAGALEGVLVDLNADGRLDLAIEGAADASVLMGNGTGGFAAPVTYSFAPAVVGDVRSGDFNGDGKPDLVISTTSATDPNSLRILLGDGSGGFGAPRVFPLPAAAIRAVPVDVNDDGKTDLVASYAFGPINNPVADFVSVLIGDGTGSFAAPVSVPLNQTSGQSLAFALGDLNHDGHQDLGVTEIRGSGRQFVLLFGTGTGGFTPQLLGDVPSTVNIVTSGDVTGDGNLDLMGSAGSVLQVWIGDGTGAFTADASFVAPSGGEVRLADFNGDRRLDAAVAITQGGGVSILLNTCGQPPADLSLTMTDTPDPVDEGSPVTYAAAITNQSAVVGATDVQFTLALPANLTDASATPTQGTCSVGATIITCNLGTLAAGASAGVDVIATPRTGTPVSVTAGVSSAMGDEDAFDNTVVVQTSVTPVGRTFFVTNTNNAGPGSLRQAISDSNADAGDVDRIHFNIPGTGPFAIVLTSALPNLTQPVVIDATTEPGYAGSPLVQLVGNATGSNGLSVAAGNTTIRGLSITGFPGNGIQISGPGGNVVEANHIGVSPSGTVAAGNSNSGVDITDSSNNRIGGPLSAQMNVVSANGAHGIAINGGFSAGNLVQGNLIGTDRAGAVDLGNGGQGVLVTSATNTIGGGTPGAGNVISGNGGSGIWLLGGSAINNLVAGNLIGTNRLGTASLGNSVDGVTIGIGTSNVVGGSAPGLRNVISGNGRIGVLIEGTGATGNRVTGNYIGTDVTGTADLGNGFDGVFVSVVGNTIGGSAAADGNVISGNGRAGVYLGGSVAGNNAVLFNIIGLDANGSAAVPNGTGVYLESSANTVGAPSSPNRIAGNLGAGVDVRSTGNTISGNRIDANGGLGIDLGGNGVTANDQDDADAGANGQQNFPVLTRAVLSATQFDLDVTFNSVAARAYTIEYFRSPNCDPSGFGEGAQPAGVTTLGAIGNPTVQFTASMGAAGFAVGQFITATATSSDGTSEFSTCIQVTPAPATPQTFVVTNTNDSGPGSLRQAILDANAVTTTQDTIAFNIPGTGTHTISPLSGLPVLTGPVVIDATTQPGFAGSPLIELDGTSAGGTANGLWLTSSGSVIRGFVINRFGTGGAGGGGGGIVLQGGGNHIVEGNFVGTDVTGTIARPNRVDGVWIDSPANRIGGTTASARNVISGNGRNGIELAGAGAAGNTVLGNYIGVDRDGVADLGNTGFGIDVFSAPSNIIGGTTSAARNVISGNNSNGMMISGSTATSNVVQGNYVGTNAAGTAPVGNSFEGITLFASSNTIGGTAPGAGNVIAANRFGLWVNSGDNNVIQGNFVGTNAASATGLGNVSTGMIVFGTGNIVGGTAAGAGNVIVANGGDGLRIAGSGSVGEIVQGNFIGTNPAGVAGLGNNGPGIWIFNGATNHVIGGTAAGAGNVIARNTGAGISITDAATRGNAIRGNSIYSNGGLGIDLQNPGITANDPADVDSGSNNLQNFPVLTSAVTDGSTTTISGTLNSTPNTTFRVEFFTSTACDASGNGEGQTFIGATSVTTDGAGNASIPFVAPQPGQFITASATSSTNDTSEFSACVQAQTTSGALALALVDATVVGVGRSAMLRVTLPSAAPAAGVTVTVASSNANVLSVVLPRTISFASGATVGQIALTGVAAGTATVTATAPNYTDGTLDVVVTENLISTPGTLPVPFGQSTALPVNIGPSPAPPGGLTLNVASADPATIEVATPVITVPAGAFSANATVRGVRIGAATVTVSNSAFSPSTTNVVSGAELNILQVSAAIYDGLPPPTLTVRLESSGTPTAAQPAVTVQLTSANPACVAVPATVTIPAGLVSATFTPTYGGAPSLPCTTQITASSSNLVSDVVDVTVNPQAGITSFGAVVVGAGLMVSTGATLGTTQHGGTQVTVTSSDPGVVSVSKDMLTVGSGSIVVTVPDGQSFVPYFVQGLENTTGSATISITAGGFIGASHPVTIVAPGVEIQALDPSTSTLSLDDTDWYLQVGIPSTDGSTLLQAQVVRPGQPLILTVTNSNPVVGRLRSDEPAAVGQVVTKPIQPGTSFTRAISSGTNWGLGFEPLANGLTTVTVSGPAGMRTLTTSGVREVQVSGASISAPPTLVVGAGLMTSTGANLSASGHGGIDVTLTSSDPSKMRVSRDTTTAGAASITINVPNGQAYVPYYVQGVEDTTGSATLTIAAEGFGEATHTVNVVAPGVEIYLLDATTSTLAGEDIDWYAQAGIPNSDGTSLSQVQLVRPGSGMVLTFTNSNAAVARLRSDEPAAVGQVVTKPIQPGMYFTRAVTEGTTWGLAFDPLANGTTTVTVTGPAGAQTMSVTGVRQVNVANASITPPANSVVGAHLMTPAYALLSAGNHGGIDVTVTSSDPAKLRLSADGLTAGTASVTIPLANGQTFVQYYLLGVDNAVGTATVTISADSYGQATHQVEVVAPGVEIYGLDAEMSNLSADDTDWYVQVGLPNQDGTSLYQVQLVQPGPPLVVTLTNSQATVGRLHSDEPVASGQTVTKPILPGSYYTLASQPGSLFGIRFEPLANGTTTVTASGASGIRTMTATGVRTVEITTPRIIVPSTATVGSGLQTPVSGSLNGSQHGGVSVSISSSAPDLVRVSPDATTAGTASFSYSVANNETAVPFFIQGMENVTGTAVVTLSAPGFTTATMTVTVAASGIDVQGLSLVTNAGAQEEVNWYVSSGIADVSGSGLAVAQAVRAGSPGFVVTLSASNTLAQLRSDQPVAVGQSVTKPIAPGNYYTTAVGSDTTYGLGFKALGAGEVVVAASGPAGVIATSQASRTIVINP